MTVEQLKNGVKSYFTSDDLTCNFLTKPLRSHYNFFSEKIDKTSNSAGKFSWGTLQVISGIVTSPILIGGAALGGLLNIPEAIAVFYTNYKQVYKESEGAIPSIKKTIENGAQSDETALGQLKHKIRDDQKIEVQLDFNLDEDNDNIHKKIKDLITEGGWFKRHELKINATKDKLRILDIYRA